MSNETKRAKKIILPVTGMTCATCVATIEKGLAKVPGVSQVNVNLATEKASIEYDSSKVDTKALMDTISDVGYGVAVEKTTFSVGGMTCASCVTNVEKALVKVPGVISANVNLASEKATVEYLAGEASMTDFKRAVEGAGYHVLEEEKSGRKKVIFMVTGMTCASCVTNIEKALVKVPGVISVNVNLASEKATVEYDASKAGMTDFRKAVEGAGYGIGVEVSAEGIAEPDSIMAATRREIRALKTKLIFAGSIGLFMLLIAVSEFTGRWMPSFFGNHYLLWALATPVQFWAGWQFYQGTWARLKHKGTNMNTLIAVGTSAAYFYSVAAILFPGFFTTGGRGANVYFDTAAIIIALILLAFPGGQGQGSDLRGNQETYRYAGQDSQGGTPGRGIRHPYRGGSSRRHHHRATRGEGTSGWHHQGGLFQY